MVVVLGLLAALTYGLADFAGGFASRTYRATNVLLYSYPVGAVLAAALLPLFGGHFSGRVLGFGILGGLAGIVGVILMYSLMAIAPMNVISPITALLAAIVPVAVGIGIGERPSALAWGGMVLGIGAVLLVSRTSEHHPHGRIAPKIIALACLAGVGFGLYFVFLARAGDDAGLWPLVVSRITSGLLIVPIAVRARATTPIRGRYLLYAVGAGLFDASANMFFLLATHRGLLSVASVVSSLYPATTVILAIVLLREHVSRTQQAGLALAAASIVLITV